MACGCGKKVPVNTMGWTVDLNGSEKTFVDGKSVKVFATVGEANVAVARLGLSGTVRPRPATTSDTA